MIITQYKYAALLGLGINSSYWEFGEWKQEYDTEVK